MGQRGKETRVSVGKRELPGNLGNPAPRRITQSIYLPGDLPLDAPKHQDGKPLHTIYPR